MCIRDRFDPHCDFSSTYYLDEGGRLVAMSRYDQNDEDTERTDFVQKTNKYTVKRWKGQEERVMDTPLMRFAERTLTHSFCISGTVSYTHLDVYKRQVVRGAGDVVVPLLARQALDHLVGLGAFVAVEAPRCV